MNNSTKLFDYYTKLELPHNLPKGIEILNPYSNIEVIEINRQFYHKFYNDNNPRTLLLGINPGRLGAGITGISFTDPIELENHLGISNSFQKKPELSAGFIHQVIRAYGGPEKFYSKFLVTSISPIGFIKNNININYYDEKDLEEALKTYIETTLIEQHALTGKLNTCICIGQGKNLKYLETINKKLGLFAHIMPIGHPRWIMQYRRKKAADFIAEYVNLLEQV